MNISLNENVNYTTFEKGDILFREGESAEGFYIIAEGRVACAKNNEGRFVVVNVAGDKSIVGEDSVLCGSHDHQYGAVALEKTEAVKVETSDVLAVVNSKSEWIKNILENISDKIRNTNNLIAEHRIEDDRLCGGEPLSEEELALIKNKLG